MKAVVLGAGRAMPLRGRPTPKCLLEAVPGWRVLDWLLVALREGAGADRVVFVGGDHLEEVEAAYPQLEFVHNEDWERHHVLGSLFCRDELVDGPFLTTYADVAFRPDTARTLAAAGGDIVVVVDRSWRRRYEGRGDWALAKAEKVRLRDGRVAAIGRGLELGEADGEFVGLARFSAHGAAALRHAFRTLEPLYGHRPWRGNDDLYNGSLGDLLQELVEQGVEVRAVEVNGGWAEMDAPEDLSQFVFGTKAETLERLRPLLSHAEIADGVRLEVSRWIASPEGIAQELARRFAGGPVAVRSSAHGEDGQLASMAGAFHSVIGVEGGDAGAIAAAVEEVVASYTREREVQPGDQVLVQPALTGVAMSGVLLTRDLDTGAPYLVVSYDDESGSTQTVTAGAASRTVRLHRGAPGQPDDPRLRRLVQAAGELEAITGSDALDVEFAFTDDDTLHVLQVRPIAARSGWRPADDAGVAAEADAARQWLARRLGPMPGVPGASTALGQMPDWNPAEMIGPFPLPLARSLYERLVTDDSWRSARASLGYASPPPVPLMVEIAGRPYVDVRLSANNLLPAWLEPELRAEVVDAGMARLRAQPELHDKVEFELWPTCMELDLERGLGALREHGLRAASAGRVRQVLVAHTARLLREGEATIRGDLARCARLAPACDELLAADGHPAGHPARARQLLATAIEDGVVPFARLARLAFVGSALLRSLLRRGVLDRPLHDRFCGSIRTVGSELLDSLPALHRGGEDREAFLRRYGHLRPGSYDILSPRYDHTPELYFRGDAHPRGACPDEAGNLPAPVLKDIDRALASSGLGVDARSLLRFIRLATAAREEAKFAFTRNLSWALELIAQWGAQLGLSREELACLELDDVLAAGRGPASPRLADHLLRRVAEARVRRERQRQIRLPQLILSPGDIDVVHDEAARANFVGTGRVGAPLVALGPDAHGAGSELEGRIVLLEGADPGHDWIFARGIAGLVTAYGGANSHMAIRCAEFGLPAAIGVGPALQATLSRAARVELDCGGEAIRVLA